MTRSGRERIVYAVSEFYWAVNRTPAGHALIQAKKRELINRGVIKEGGSLGREENNIRSA